jgi:hypothetical protein
LCGDTYSIPDASHPGVGVNALGRGWHEYPDPFLPYPWMPQPAIEAKQRYAPGQLVQIQRGEKKRVVSDGIQQSFDEIFAEEWWRARIDFDVFLM